MVFERLTSITVTKEAPDAVAILDSYPPFGFIFLDHDLGLFTGSEGDGLQVAKHLAAFISVKVDCGRVSLDGQPTRLSLHDPVRLHHRGDRAAV